MLGHATDDYESPRRHAASCESAGRWTQTPYVVDGVLVQVDDVDAHHRRASAAGAVVLTPPEDSPHGRLYRAEDVEGHRWMFLERGKPGSPGPASGR
jgi:uncharacterized glyoxalase superfamily protein PhnB